MGYSVNGTSITMVRGDTLRVTVEVFQGEPPAPYTFKDGDRLRFAVKKKLYKGSDYTELIDVDPLINKAIPTDTCLLELEPSDTQDLPFGTYLYDIELTMADGTVDTFIKEAKFKLTTEVH